MRLVVASTSSLVLSHRHARGEVWLLVLESIASRSIRADCAHRKRQGVNCAGSSPREKPSEDQRLTDNAPIIIQPRQIKAAGSPRCGHVSALESCNTRADPEEPRARVYRSEECVQRL